MHSDTGTKSLMTCLAPYFNSSSSSITTVGSCRSYCGCCSWCWGTFGGRTVISGTVTSAYNRDQSICYYPLQACRAYRAVIYMLLRVPFSTGLPPPGLVFGGVYLPRDPRNVCVHQSCIFGRGFKIAFRIRH